MVCHKAVFVFICDVTGAMTIGRHKTGLGLEHVYILPSAAAAVLHYEYVYNIPWLEISTLFIVPCI